jgi:hypothetical protein
MPQSTLPPTHGEYHAYLRRLSEAFSDDGHSALSHESLVDPEDSATIIVGTAPVTLGHPNARSYIHGGHRGDIQIGIPLSRNLKMACLTLLSEAGDWPHYSFAGVREQTAELANIALLGTTPHHDAHHDNLNPRPILSAARGSHSRDLFESARSSSYPRVSASPSHLSHLFRKDQLPVGSPGESRGDYDDDNFDSGSECDPLVVRPHKRYGAIDYSIPEAAQEEEDDLESQRRYRRKSSARPRHGSTNRGRKWPKNGVGAILKLYDKPKWSSRDIWEKGIVQPVQYLPAVFLGLLLNILDGLSYGMILFPLGESMFSDLGPDGLSMFYVSCIVSQLVYSCGGSAFRGGVGSEMVRRYSRKYESRSVLLTN